MVRFKQFLIIGMIVNASFAEQFKWWDDEVNWNSAPESHGFCPQLDGPVNWQSPVNYRDGQIYVKYTVSEKPTDLKVCLQFCHWDGSLETCGGCNQTGFSTKGTFHAELLSPSKWWSKSTKPSWTHSGYRCVIIMNNSTRKWMDTRSKSWCMGSSAAQHMPIKIKIEAYVVSAGATFAPPAGWDDGGATHMVIDLDRSNNPAPANRIVAKKAGDNYIVRLPSTGMVSLARINGSTVFARHTGVSRELALPGSRIKPGMYMLRIEGAMTTSCKLVMQ